MAGHPVFGDGLIGGFLVGFSCHWGPLIFCHRDKGGGGGKKRGGVASKLSLNSFVFRGLSLLIGPPVPNGRKRGGRERPPPKSGGGHVTSDSGAEWHASIRPHAGRSRPHLSLREGSEKTPHGGGNQAENGPMEWRELVPFLRALWHRPAGPLSLAPNDSRSVLAAKGPLRRFAPWTAPGRSGRPLFTREKGGLLPGSSPGGR